MNAKEHKHINVIRDNWLNKLKLNDKKKILHYFISFFKNKYYNKMNNNIKKIVYINVNSNPKKSN